MLNVIRNGFLYNWPERQFQMSKKNKKQKKNGGGDSQGSSAAVRLARDSWGVTA